MKVDVNGVKYNVAVRGKGIPLVMLHGFSESMNTFRSINSEEYQVIYIDLIGHGKTDSPKEIKYYNLHHLLKDINFIINRITKEKYVIYGYSMGGRIALAYSFIYSSEIKGLILESASYGETDLIKRKNRRLSDYRLAKKIESNGIKWFVDYWTNIPIFDSQKFLDEETRNEIRDLKFNNNINGLTKSLIGFSQGRLPALKEKIPEIKIKTLYISGELDSKYTSMGQEFKKMNSDITHKIVKSAGHNVHIERPYEVKKIINKFIRMG